MSTHIAGTAVVDPRAKIGRGVQVGHFCVVGPDVSIGDGTILEENAIIKGVVRIGEENHIFPGCVIGGHPQDTSYANTPTRVDIGDGNTFREHCTVNRGTEKEDGVTRIGNNNFFMTACHIAHDCKIGDRIVIANNAMLGGHVHIDNDVTLAGGVGVHHFASIGAMAFVSAMSRVLHDVPPFVIVDGQPAKPRAVNSIGLKRHDFPRSDIQMLSRIYRMLYRERKGLDATRVEVASEGPFRPAIKQFFDFVQRSNDGSNGRGRQLRKAA
ncbi:MAG: acyl-ACP--UDP-N-acetylglucosamine O-acyltransferase [Planctomycetota bacterium]